MLDKLIDAMVSYEEMCRYYGLIMKGNEFDAEYVDKFLVSAVELAQKDVLKDIIESEADELIETVKEIKKKVMQNAVS